jgi:hypothetical protein
MVRFLCYSILLMYYSFISALVSSLFVERQAIPPSTIPKLMVIQAVHRRRRHLTHRLMSSRTFMVCVAYHCPISMAVLMFTFSSYCFCHNIMLVFITERLQRGESLDLDEEDFFPSSNVGGRDSIYTAQWFSNQHVQVTPSLTRDSLLAILTNDGQGLFVICMIMIILTMIILCAICGLILCTRIFILFKLSCLKYFSSHTQRAFGFVATAGIRICIWYLVPFVISV